MLIEECIFVVSVWNYYYCLLKLEFQGATHLYSSSSGEGLGASRLGWGLRPFTNSPHEYKIFQRLRLFVPPLHTLFVYGGEIFFGLNKFLV